MWAHSNCEHVGLFFGLFFFVILQIKTHYYENRFSVFIPLPNHIKSTVPRYEVSPWLASMKKCREKILGVQSSSVLTVTDYMFCLQMIYENFVRNCYHFVTDFNIFTVSVFYGQIYVPWMACAPVYISLLQHLYLVLRRLYF